MDTSYQLFEQVETHLNRLVLGQKHLVRRLLIALLADGHLLVEGPPGIAKTRAIQMLSSFVDCDFQRIQFTPDLLPSDILGTDVFHPQDGRFSFQPGPIFHHLILADEINRAPPKAQSALLEAMAERQVTLGQKTRDLPDPFLVMATQNPLEQEGTHPLPEAQLDRFLLHVEVGYPPEDMEKEILRLTRHEAKQSRLVQKKPDRLSLETLRAARLEVLDIHMAENLEDYLVRLVTTTRNPAVCDKEGRGEELALMIRLGASPRATMALDRAARAQAWLSGRESVLPDDILDLAADVLRHRLLLTWEAEAQGITTTDVIEKLLTCVSIP
ncbi:AAA family ATPase [Magnetococcales bacterium HHB-1]